MRDDRRKFLKTSALTAVAATLTPSLFGEPRKSTAGEDYKALVCIMLEGGADSLNMVVPRDNLDAYLGYVKARPRTALHREKIRQLRHTPYGMHPRMPRMQRLFNHGKLAIVANVGPLHKPLSKEAIYNAKVAEEIDAAPAQLFHHVAQRDTWMRSAEGESGWAAEVAEQIGGRFFNISVGGYNQMQEKQGYRPLIAHDDIYGTDPFMQQVARADVSTSFEADESFEGKSLAEQLSMTLDLIEHRHKAGFSKRQIYFVSDGGWDLHTSDAGSQAAFEKKVENLDHSLYEFAKGLEQLGLSDKVTTFTMSDFGRTLTESGDDHGWGGHAFVMGSAVKSGIWGEMPQIAPDSPHTLANGALIPTTASQQYLATLVAWLGDEKIDLTSVFPGLKQFKEQKMGFIV